MTASDSDRSPLLDSTRDLTREVLVFGPISRRALSGRLGLSSASLTRLIKPMIDRGVLREGMHVTDGQVGRPTRPLEVVVESNTFIGITVGRADVRAVLTDFRANEVASEVVSTESGSPEHVITAMETAVGLLAREITGRSARITGIGIAVDGQVQGDRISSSRTLGWTDVELAPILSTRLGIPVAVENDIIAVAYAEDLFGSGRGLPGFAVLSMGHSLGYGLVLGGRMITTVDTGIGLPAHPMFEGAGLSAKVGCPLGSLLTIDGICTALTAKLGRRVDESEAVTLVRDGDPVAVAVADAASAAVGRVVGAIASFALVSTVVLVGPGTELISLRLDALLESAGSFRDPRASPLSVVVERPDRDYTSRGAAAVAISRSVDDGSFLH